MADDEVLSAELQAGRTIGRKRRITPLDLIEGEAAYDSRWYIRYLAETCSSTLEPFDSKRKAEGLVSTYVGRETRPLD